MTLASRQIVSRNLGMTVKFYPILATVASDIFVDEFLKFPGVLKQNYLPHLKVSTCEAARKSLLSFPFPKQNSGNVVLNMN